MGYLYLFYCLAIATTFAVSTARVLNGLPSDVIKSQSLIASIAAVEMGKNPLIFLGSVLFGLL